jgi:hypothetical protein
MLTAKRYLTRLEALVDNPTFLKGTTSAQRLVLHLTIWRVNTKYGRQSLLHIPNS